METKNSSNSSKNKSTKVGNTKLLSVDTEKKNKKKQPSPAKHWVFTFNNYTENDYIKIVDYYSSNSSTYDVIIFQEEIGDSGTRHLQGCQSYKVGKGRPFNQGLNKSIHWESKGKFSTLQQMRDYCCDPKKRAPNGRCFLFNYQEPQELKIIRRSQLYKWQIFIIDEISKEANDRDIIWIYGSSGLGKTQFTKYLVYHHGAIQLQGNRRHILKVVSQHLRTKLFVFLLTMNDMGNAPYSALEQVKDGLFMSHFGCDNTEPVIMNSPHILVFANNPPEKFRIAAKKLKIINLDTLEEMIEIKARLIKEEETSLFYIPT